MNNFRENASSAVSQLAARSGGKPALLLGSRSQGRHLYEASCQVQMGRLRLFIGGVVRGKPAVGMT